MKILSLEFSSSRRSAAVGELNDGGGIQVLSAAHDVAIRGVNSMTLVDRAIHDAGVAPSAIDAVVLGLGPGSYAGVRGAIAIAQGWQLARGVKLLGLSSVDCLAAEARVRGLHGEIAILVDAQRQEFYQAVFNLHSGGVTLREPLRIVPRASLSTPGLQAAGPEISSIIPGSIDLFPTAETLLAMAESLLVEAAPVSGESLEPIYLREASFVKAAPPRIVPSAE